VTSWQGKKQELFAKFWLLKIVENVCKDGKNAKFTAKTHNYKEVNFGNKIGILTTHNFRCRKFVVFVKNCVFLTALLTFLTYDPVAFSGMD